jgi:alkylation response protein AidB-like acyl-CoA dehydrogenase
MELILSDEQRLLNESAGKFFARLGGPKRTRQWRNHPAGFDRDCLRAMADNGWLRMLVKESRGGLGLGPLELALVLHQAGRALAPEPVAGAALAALAVSESDDDAARDALLARVMRGDAVVGAAVQGPTGSIEAGEAGVTAVRSGHKWQLDGTATFVPCAGGCDGFLVGAGGADGPLVCHIARDAPGLDIRLVPTVDGRPYGDLTFRGTPPDQIIARGNSATALLRRHVNLALLAASAEILGLMERIGEMTVDYLKTRRQFDRPIGSFQALQHRAVDNYVLIESTRSLLYQICEGGEPLSDAMVSALKAAASSAALTVAKSAIQLHGAIGFTDEHDAGLYLKRAMWLSAFLGNAAAHQRRYARLR